MSNNIYNILGKLSALTESAKPAETSTATVYESVEARGSITEAVRSLEGKYAEFKESKAKPDFLDVDKDGDKAEPFKKAVKDKKAGGEDKSADKGMSAKQAKYFGKKKVSEGAGPYTLDDPKHPKFKANYEKFKKSNPDCKLADFVAAMRKKEKGLSEGMDDLTDLDAYQFAEPDKDSAVKPASAKQAAADRRRRLQDIEDRRAEKNDSYSGTKSNVRNVAGKAYGGSAQKDDSVDEATTATGGEVTRKGNVTTHKGKKYGGAETNSNAKEELGKKNIWDLKRPGKPVDLGDPEDYELDEVAPPGAKAERMVKGIKKGYSRDGNLSKKEKGIAYATAYKAKNAGQVEEGVEFKDAGKIKNSAPNMKKAKPAMVKESRVMEETDYFYEKIGKALCNKNPNLDTSTGDFASAVRKEMVAQGMEPNKARGIMLMDEDFLSDVATSYSHHCKEVSETHAPMNSHLGGMEEAMIDPHETNIPSPTNNNPVTKELDEIAALAGLATRAPAIAGAVDNMMSDSTLPAMDEEQGVTVNGKAINVRSIEVDGVDPSDRPDFADAYITYAEFADGTPLSEDELVQLEQDHGDLVNQAANDNLQDKADFLDEDDVAEGNEFSGALKAAREKGEKEFEVDGKRYTVKEDINVNITANGQEDALNLFRKLAGMEEVASAQPVAQVVELPQDLESALAQGVIEPMEEERDIEYANTPNEKIGPVSAAIPSGTDLNRSKKQYRKEYPGDNPMAVKEDVEDSLWKKYSGMLKGLIK